MKEHITWQSLQKKKINQKRKHSEERRKEFNDHPVFQCFLCWVNSWVLLVRECRHCLPVEPWGSMAQQGWEQLSPPCHLCCRGEKRRRCFPQPLRGGLLTPSTSRVPTELCPAPIEHRAPLGEEPRAFHCHCLILLQQPVPRSCGAASHLWGRLWKSYCCSCLEWWSGEGSHTAPWIFITKTKALVLCSSPFLCTSNPCTINYKVRKRGADRETD